MNSIPLIVIEGNTLPEVWEKAVLSTWEKGISIPTEYDREGCPPSKDASVVMSVENPFQEPRIHRAFPAGLEELEIYRQEVVDGIHDHWIAPEEGKWSYTYHQRLFSFPGKKIVDQIEYIMAKLAETPYTRRAQAITWEPTTDPGSEDPPCLQRIWFRIFPLEKGKGSLNMHTYWRSRDGFKAAFMNMFALTDLQKRIAEGISERRGEKITAGRYVDICDSFHIYGYYFEEFQKFLDTMNKRTFEDRTWNSEFAEPFFANILKGGAKE